MPDRNDTQFVARGTYLATILPLATALVVIGIWAGTLTAKVDALEKEINKTQELVGKIDGKIYDLVAEESSRPARSSMQPPIIDSLDKTR